MKKRTKRILKISFWVCLVGITFLIIFSIIFRPIVIFDESEMAEHIASNALDKRFDVADYRVTYAETDETDILIWMTCDVKPSNEIAAFDWSAAGRSENGWNMDCCCWAKYYNIGPVYFSFLTFNAPE